MGFDFQKAITQFTKLAGEIKATNNGDFVDFTKAMDRALALIQTQTKAGHKIIFIGNGGSAAISSHMATDYMKNGGVRAVSFNDPSLLTCLSNDYSYTEAFEKCVERFADSGDILVAISSSGQSKNILNSVETACAKGCSVVTLSGFNAENPLRNKGMLNFYVDSHKYSYVENLHLLVCHIILDGLMAENSSQPVATRIIAANQL